ncbi:speckle-type POZ protein B [Nephila pilipes]|uniref:Speckle-type POZ protein B n=1 Tax=Nephila pilipes TaxID=299642 RepID=A0A8X6KJI5_NEPPI|nr:speckle-type POZ protein B [Nephila pilipes]
MEKKEDIIMPPFTYIWTIENYPKLATTGGVHSPKFIVDSLEGTKWFLEVYMVYNTDLFHCALWRTDDSGPESIEIEFEFSILAANGTPLIENKNIGTFEKRNFQLVKDFDFIKDFSKRRDEFLPKNSVTVRCRMWRPETKISRSDLCFARTRLGAECISFVWPIEGFSTLKPGEERSRTLKLTLKGFSLSLKLAIFFKKDYDGEFLYIKTVKTDATREFHMTWEISLMGNDGERLMSNGGHRLMGRNESNKVLGNLFETMLLKARGSPFFPNDTLCLKCDFEFFIGDIWSRIEYLSTGVSDETDVEIDNSNNNLAFCCPLKICIEQLFNDKSLSDINFRVDDELLPAHSSILGARSLVFKDMFASEMKKEIRIIDVLEVNLDTFRLLLKYVYTDTLPDINWENAIELFKAADKYELSDLRSECFTFIKLKLSLENVCDVIKLLYSHKDDYLQKAVDILFKTRDLSIFL